jgi:hypothetical protein
MYVLHVHYTSFLAFFSVLIPYSLRRIIITNKHALVVVVYYTTQYIIIVQRARTDNITKRIQYYIPPSGLRGRYNNIASQSNSLNKGKGKGGRQDTTQTTTHPPPPPPAEAHES